MAGWDPRAWESSGFVPAVSPVGHGESGGRGRIGLVGLVMESVSPRMGRATVNRPKVIGTRAETAVVNFARGLGFHEAERLALKGSDDHGDIRLCRRPLVILEVKAGKTAQDASWNQIQAWMKETMRERDAAWRAHNDKESPFHGFLVTQRRGYGIGRVEDWCVWSLPDDQEGSLELGVPGMFPLGGFLWVMKERWSYV